MEGFLGVPENRSFPFRNGNYFLLLCHQTIAELNRQRSGEEDHERERARAREWRRNNTEQRRKVEQVRA